MVIWHRSAGHTLHNKKWVNLIGIGIILKSKNSQAKGITAWITHEVLPSIRKYGEYKLSATLKKQIDDLNLQIKKQKDDYDLQLNG